MTFRKKTWVPVVCFAIAVLLGIAGGVMSARASGEREPLVMGFVLLGFAVYMLIVAIVQLGKGIEVDSQIGVKIGGRLIRWSDFIEASLEKAEPYYSTRSMIAKPLIGDKLTAMAVRIRYKDEKGREKSLTMPGLQRARDAVELMNDCARRYSDGK
jgi:hypothetical protein